MTRIRVDFNSIGSDGKLHSLLDRADGPVAAGDTVTAWEDEGPGYGELSFPVKVLSVGPSMHGDAVVVRMELPVEGGR